MRTTVTIMHNDGRIENVMVTGIIRELVGRIETLEEGLAIITRQLMTLKAELEDERKGTCTSQTK